MKLNKGFSIVGLMAVVAIVAIIAVVSIPVYNQYIERTKVSKEIPVIGTYKNDIASCFMKNDSLEDCNDGERGIHPGLDNEGKILSLDVFKGNIVMIIDAQNHMENVEPIELMYVVNPNLDATFPTLDWTLYCNDYSSDNNALVKECNGLITDKDGDGYDDSVEEEWGSDPLDPDSVPVNWQSIAPTYTDWTNDGGRNYTNDWSPEASNQTTNFTQTRDYEQVQTRERTDREQDSFSGDIRVVDVVTEMQTLTGQESRNVVVSNTSGGWTNTGSTYSCSAWTPATSDYYETQMFEQTRVCSQNQESTYTYNVGGSFTDTQTVNVTEERTVEGTQPLWVDISNDVSDWTNVGGRNYTSAWTPSATGQTSDFTQTRSYTQEQERTISEREQNQLNGDIRVVSSTVEEQTITGQESRVVSVNIGAWVDTGSTFSCGAWTPAANTAYETQDVEQTRVCSQSQERTYSYSNGETYTETQTINVTEERTVEGTQPLWVDISNDVSDWTNVGSRNYTSSWEPNIVGQTSDFTQTRSYTQEQERTISEREENQLTGDIRVVNSTTETQTITGQESRNASVSETAWQNVGGVFDCSAWSPATSTVNEGQTFTQSRDCLQEQEKTYTYSANSSTIGSMTINRDTQVTENRQATGTNPVWVPTTPSYGTWTDVGSRTYTSGWSPAIDNQTSNFTQTRSYNQEQERTVSQREENSSTGDIRVVSTSTETRTVSDSASRTVTVSEGSWINSGGVYGCGTWSPSINGQTSDFTQTRSCSQNQTKTYTYSVGGSHTVSQTVSTTQSRTVDVSGSANGGAGSWSAWSTYNTACGGWGPSTANYPQGQTFTQTRSCTDYQESFKYYVINGQVVDSDRRTRTTPRTESRGATGTKVITGSWVNVGNVYYKDGPHQSPPFQATEADVFWMQQESLPSQCQVGERRVGRLNIQYPIEWLDHYYICQ